MRRQDTTISRNIFMQSSKDNNLYSPIEFVYIFHVHEKCIHSLFTH